MFEHIASRLDALQFGRASRVLPVPRQGLKTYRVEGNNKEIRRWNSLTAICMKYWAAGFGIPPIPVDSSSTAAPSWPRYDSTRLLALGSYSDRFARFLTIWTVTIKGDPEKKPP